MRNAQKNLFIQTSILTAELLISTIVEAVRRTVDLFITSI